MSDLKELQRKYDEMGRILEKLEKLEAAKSWPKSWEELSVIRGYYVSSMSNQLNFKGDPEPDHENKNVWATKELAEAALAMAQLSQLRDRYRAVGRYKES